MSEFTHTLVTPARGVGVKAYITETRIAEVSDALLAMVPEDRGFLHLDVDGMPHLVNVAHVLSFTGLTTEAAAEVSAALDRI